MMQCPRNTIVDQDACLRLRRQPRLQLCKILVGFHRVARDDTLGKRRIFRAKRYTLDHLRARDNVHYQQFSRMALGQGASQG